MRCVNLSLTPDAKTTLYAAAKTAGVTLGEALMILVRAADAPPVAARGGRAPAQRRGVATTAVFVLLTHDEATELQQLAAHTGHSISALACVVGRT